MATYQLTLDLSLILLIFLEFKHSEGAARESIGDTWLGVCGNTEHEVPYMDSDAVGLDSSNNKTTGLNSERENRHPNKSGFNNRKGELNLGAKMIIERLKRELVMVRLNVVYDSSFAEEFSRQEDLENYVRNIIFATQFVFNQKELAEHVKINLVVVSLRKSDSIYHSEMVAKDIHDEFSTGSDIVERERADLNILMMFRNMWAPSRSRRASRRAHDSRYSQIKILGQATVGAFCNKELTAALTIITSSLGSAIVLAHEIAHSFGVQHDGEGTSGACKEDLYIMYFESSSTRLTWSPCSVNRIRDEFVARAGCVFDPVRMNSSKPLKPLFDLTPTQDNPNINLLPGQSMTIDAQCAQALDKNARSSLNAFGRNGNERYDTCQSLVCSIGNYMEVAIGPAPAGSQCRQTNGYCISGSCVPKIGK